MPGLAESIHLLSGQVPMPCKGFGFHRCLAAELRQACCGVGGTDRRQAFQPLGGTPPVHRDGKIDDLATADGAFEVVVADDDAVADLDL